jgi:hypothetical protein
MEAINPPKRQFLKEPDGVTSQKTAFFKADKAAAAAVVRPGGRFV